MCVAVSGCCQFSGPRWHGRRTDHFDGEHFQNQVETHIGDLDVVRWRVNRHPGPWPKWAEVTPGPPPPERSQELRVTFVNHATVLIQLEGVNLLTDPVFADVVGPTWYIGRERHRPPGIRFEDLPPIDAVLISHDHYDHLDMEALQRLHRKFNPRIYAGLGMRKLLYLSGVHNVIELDWFKWAPLRSLRVTGVPARHGCRRGACDRNARLWLGFLVRSRSGDVYFAGDTGAGPHFQQIRDRYGPPALALLPISPGLPHALFAPVHLDAHDAVWAARVLGARRSIPIHFGTFSQGDEGDGEAEAKLRREAGPDWTILHNGESWGLTTRPAGGGS